MAITALIINALQAERQIATAKLQDAFERINKVASRLPGLIMQYRLKKDGSTTMLFASEAIEAILKSRSRDIQNHVDSLVKRIDPADKVFLTEPCDCH